MNTVKNKYRLVCLCLIALTFLVSFSCSKETKPDDDNPGVSAIKMNVNGAQWNSMMTTLITEEKEESDFGKYYLVSLMGNRVIEKNSATEDDLAESITFFIAIPASKFKNPKGSYPIVWQNDAVLNESSAVFGTSTDLRDALTYVASPNGKSGAIEITGFETGPQQIMGHPTGTDGYVKLSGTFHATLEPLKGTGSGTPLKITDGTFNLKAGINVDL